MTPVQAALQFTQRLLFAGWGARPGLPGKPHLLFKLQLLELAQRDPELVGLSTKTSPVGRGFSGFFFFRLLSLLILHHAQSYARPPHPAMRPLSNTRFNIWGWGVEQLRCRTVHPSTALRCPGATGPRRTGLRCRRANLRGPLGHEP